MNSPAVSRYESPLRERQKSATRELILDAVERRLQDAGLEALSFAEIAAEAEVSLRTVYRHFPTKDDLLDAFWNHLHGSLGIDAFPSTAAELIALPERVFPLFDAKAPVIRGMLASSQGREVRLRVNSERQAAIRRAVADGVGDLPEPEFTRLCAAVQLLYSATAWVTMRDYWGLDGGEAGRAASGAIAAVLDAHKKTGDDR